MVRIAVIDDSPEFVELVADALAMRGWDSCAHTRTDCLLPCLRRDVPDVILLDLWLGRGISGWDLLTSLRDDPVLHTVPVIVCSAAGDELRRRSQWLEDHKIDRLDKPFDIDDLYRAVENVLISATRPW
jgi:two-component system response regulator BaeR